MFSVVTVQPPRLGGLDHREKIFGVHFCQIMCKTIATLRLLLLLLMLLLHDVVMVTIVQTTSSRARMDLQCISMVKIAQN